MKNDERGDAGSPKGSWSECRGEAIEDGRRWVKSPETVTMKTARKQVQARTGCGGTARPGLVGGAG